MQTMLQALPKTGRTTRRPSHSFQLRSKPWVIQPFLLAPVLPGETLKNALLQARVVTDPIKNPLIGWWSEYYLFYVKHRDLVDRDAFMEMMLDPAWSMASYISAADVPTYHTGGTINWTKKCLERVTDVFFRTEDETASTASGLLGGMPLAAIGGTAWHQNLTSDTAMVAMDVNVDGPDANTTIQASEVDAAMRQWQALIANGMTQMSYEDYLATYGIRPRPEEAHEPELIRFVREWSYPSNTVDPTTGTPSSAVSWAIAERADKDRFFREPGFVFGVTTARPKVYISNQVGSVAGWLNNAMAWLPALMSDNPYTSFAKFADAAASGPLGASQAAAYWVDLKDLFLYGDQFINFALTETDAGLVALPQSDGQRRYVASADIDALFVNAAGGKNLIRQDGVVSMTIQGSLKDTSPLSAGAF